MSTSYVARPCPPPPTKEKPLWWTDSIRWSKPFVFGTYQVLCNIDFGSAEVIGQFRADQTLKIPEVIRQRLPNDPVFTSRGLTIEDARRHAYYYRRYAKKFLEFFFDRPADDYNYKQAYIFAHTLKTIYLIEAGKERDVKPQLERRSLTKAEKAHDKLVRELTKTLNREIHGDCLCKIWKGWCDGHRDRYGRYQRP